MLSWNSSSDSSLERKVTFIAHFVRYDCVYIKNDHLEGKNERNTIFVDGGENKEKKAQLDISEKLNIAECKICILVKQLHFFC